jgi:hypothetical protein
MRTFKEQVEGILGVGAGIVPQEQPQDVIELSPIDEFRKNVQERLSSIKRQSVSSFCGPCGDVPASIPQNTLGSPSDMLPAVVPQQPLQPQTDILVERENDIGVKTLHGAVLGMGPKSVGDAISKLSIEKNIVDDAGIATSEFEAFVKGLKQEALEKLLGKSSPSTSGSASPTPSGTPSSQPSGEPQKKLPNLTSGEKTNQNVIEKL